MRTRTRTHAHARTHAESRNPVFTGIMGIMFIIIVLYGYLMGIVWVYGYLHAFIKLSDNVTGKASLPPSPIYALRRSRIGPWFRRQSVGMA